MNAKDQPIEGLGDLVGYFRSAEKPRSLWRVGTEHEKVGVYADTGDRVPYEGPYGIAALFDRLVAEGGWERVDERGRTIALESPIRGSITLEPGGQFELSGAPLYTTEETCAELDEHLAQVKRLSEDFDIAWLALGMDPFHPVDQIPTMPKARYDVMRRYLPTRGGLGLDMMHATATVQANYDFESEADMIAKMRVGMLATPVVSALYANSSLSGGRENGFISKRLMIWRDTDPDRCGQIPFVFEPDFGYERYANWALDVPLFFVVRGKRYEPGDGTTFRQFMDHGFRGLRPTLGDWETHLTTLFPDVRLKRIVEVRGSDTASPGHLCALPALWKGLFYDADSLEGAWELLRRTSVHELDAGQLDVAKRGLRAEMGGRKVIDLARELVALAAEGLRRIAAEASAVRANGGLVDRRGAGGPGAMGSAANEVRFLDPLLEQIDKGISPGEEVLDRWRNEWDRDWSDLIEATRF
ncbi:MAG: glutamate--cysteine ligase [Deltaproteobacteria bacterium]|nr:glutamate--cysteine ligase [Deltaproteobacteria bacterium]